MPLSMSTNLLPKDGEVYLYTKLFSECESQTLFDLLYESIEWKQEQIKIFGKWVKQPRLSAWNGEPDIEYSYSGITLKAKPWNEPLLTIRSIIQRVTDFEFNSCLLNFYRNGQDSMGWHRDNEKELGSKPVICSISLGAHRTFQMQHINDKKSKLSVELPAGSCLLMQGDTQHFWKHSLPKQPKCNEARINLTFRKIF